MHHFASVRALLFLVVLWLLGTQGAIAQQRFDPVQLLKDVETLSADSMEGRRTGTAGNARARHYLLQAFEATKAKPFGDSFEQPFSFVGLRDNAAHEGVNVVGYIPGSRHPERYITLSAHYDHLGVQNGHIFNGADDNASGTAALLAALRYFSEHPPLHSIIFLAFDAEEMALQGARIWISDPPVPLEQIVLNVNMDMISRSRDNELYAAGTFHYPFLLPHLKRVREKAGISLRFGHDSPDLPPGDDWTLSSDHGAFHEVGIPFVYFGVEDHEDYHQPTDIFEHIMPDFYVNAVDAIFEAVIELDRNLEHENR